MKLIDIFYTQNGICRGIIEGESGIEYCSNITFDFYCWCSCPAFVYSKGVSCKHIRFLNRNLERERMVDETNELPKLPTGSKIIDGLLGGGIPYKLITAIFGEPATGKSWLSYQVGVNNVKMTGKETLLIDTEGITQIDLDNILSKLGKRFGIDEETLKQKFKMVKTYNSPNLQSIQMIMQMFGYMVTFELSDKGKYKTKFQFCDATLTDEQLKNISMIIIDSFTKPIKDSIGSESSNLPARAQIVERLFGKLHQIADTYNIAIIILHHASITPPIGPYKIEPKPYGGNPIMYNSKYILQFWNGTKKEKEIKCAENKKKQWQIEARRIQLMRRPDEQATKEKIPIRLQKDMGFVDE